jgi:hypothetical protein
VVCTVRALALVTRRPDPETLFSLDEEACHQRSKQLLVTPAGEQEDNTGGSGGGTGIPWSSRGR